MVQLKGPTKLAVQRRGDAFTRVVARAVTATLDEAASSLSGTVNLNDLDHVPAMWSKRLTDDLVSHVADAWDEGAGITRTNQHRALLKIRVAADAAGFEIPQVTNPLATEYMANARNRLVHVGNDMWQSARSQLLQGMQAGETMPQIRDRIRDVAGFGTARAEVISRTEIAHAMNQGSLAQMGQLPVELNTSKEWIAVNDSRTRPEHADANGEKVPLNAIFSIGEDPGDAPNCRCTLGYDIEDEPAFVETATVPEDQAPPNLGLTTPIEGLRDDTAEAIEDYTMNSDSINNHLRAGGGTTLQIHAIDRLFSQSILLKNSTLYRGANLDPGIFKVGSIFQDKAFISTTTERQVAAGYGNTLFEIEARAGDRAASIRDATGLSVYDQGDREVLFPRNSKFEVVSVTDNVVRIRVAR